MRRLWCSLWLLSLAAAIAPSRAEERARVALAADSTVQAEDPALVALAADKAVYLYWGPAPAGTVAHEVWRAGERDREFRQLARVEPMTDAARAAAILRDSPDPVSRSLTLHEQFHAKAAEMPEVDLGLSRASTGYARVRGHAWLDASVAAGTRYSYRVVRIGAGDRQTVLGETEVAPGTAHGLAAPTLQGAVHNGSPVLAWNTAPLTGYDVLRAAGSESFDKLTLLPLPAVGAAGTMSFAETSVPADGGAFTYRVVPVDLLGREGPSSNPVSLAVPASQPPDPPGGVRAEAVAAGVRLRWEPISRADLAGYHVQRRETHGRVAIAEVTGTRDPAAIKQGAAPPLASAGPGATPTGSPTARLTASPLPAGTTAYEDRTAVPGRVYHYEVVAVDRSGRESAPSAAVPGGVRDTQPPDRPAQVTATSGEGGTVRLSWSTSAEADLALWRLYVRPGGQAAPLLVAELPATGGTSYEHRLGPAASGTFRWAVTAVDASGNESSPAESADLVLWSTERLARPVLVGLVSGDGLIELRWEPVAEPGLSGYHVYRTDPGGKPVRLTERALPPGTSTFQDRGAEPGRAYVYAVTAVDRSGGESAPSDPRTASTFCSR